MMIRIEIFHEVVLSSTSQFMKDSKKAASPSETVCTLNTVGTICSQRPDQGTTFTHLNLIHQLSFPQVERFLKFARIPCPCVRVKQVTNPRYRGLTLWRHDFVISWIREPSVLPHVNPLPTAHSPNSTLLNDLPSLQNTPPSIRTLLRNNGFHNTPMR